MSVSEPAAKKEKRGSNIQLDEPTVHNLEQIRLLNCALLPVRYGRGFYQSLLYPELTRLAYYNDVFVGAICARYDQVEGKGFRVYIMTIGVLAPYRRLGIAKELLQHVERVAAEGKRHKVFEIYLHAWVSNEDGIEFYKKHEYVQGEKLLGYYKSITPPDGIIMSKSISNK